MGAREETIRLTMAQAVVKYLGQQYSERDGVEQPFFAGVWGIFGHGNVAGMGQALEEMRHGSTNIRVRPGSSEPRARLVCVSATDKRTPAPPSVGQEIRQ